MRVGKRIVAAVILTALAQCAVAADFEAGVSAFDHGDYAEALAQWRPLAEAGNALAQYNLGLLYANGWGVRIEPRQAMRWYALAAEQGNASAQYNLGRMRETGDGVPADSAEAVYWYRRAADQNLAAAQNNLALLYIEGHGVRRDPAQAIHWLEKASRYSREARANRAAYIDELPSVGIDGSSVNVRAEPSRSAAVVAQAGRGETARVLERDDDWSRIWLVDSGQTGWVANFLLRGLPAAAVAEVEVGMPTMADNDDAIAPLPRPRVKPSGATDASAADPNRAPASNASSLMATHVGWLGALDAAESQRGVNRRRVATPRLNVRERPATASSIVARLKHNTLVDVVEERGGWRRIRLPAGAGTGWVAAFLLAEP